MTEKKRFSYGEHKKGIAFADEVEHEYYCWFNEHDCRQTVDLLNEYESELQMCREKVVYWRNKANDTFGDMRTNVELEKENQRLKNINDSLRKVNEKLRTWIDDY